MKAEVCTPWGKDVEGANVPQVVLDYLYQNDVAIPGTSFKDVTDNTASSSLLNIEITADESIIQQIEADDNYLVLWSQPDEEE